jgi:hypothetical protein
MKSFCASALVLLASLSWAVDRAAAQTGAYDSAGVVAASYNLPAGGMSPYGSMFASSTPSAPANPEPGHVIDGAAGPSEFEQAVHAEWTECDASGDGPRSHWFGSLGALVMGRNRADVFATTIETGSGAGVLNTQDAGANWTGGWEVTAGYMANNCCGTGPGFGFTYWGLGQMPGFAQINSPTDQLSTTINLGAVTVGGDPATDFFDNSASQRIIRNDRVNNFEGNFYFGTWNFNRWTVVPFAGFRYFRFDERLTFGGLAAGGVWGGNGGLDEAYLRNRSVNNLYGAQIGTWANYWATDRFGLFIGPKLGLYGNQMNGRTLLYRGDGAIEYDIAAHKSDFSLLGELDVGFTYFLRRNLFTYLGYRVVGVTNVALSDNQFLPNLDDTTGFGQVKQSGSLILHGVMLGAGWMY